MIKNITRITKGFLIPALLGAGIIGPGMAKPKFSTFGKHLEKVYPVQKLYAWNAASPVLNPTTFQDLLEGKIPSIHIKNFLTQQECMNVHGAVGSVGFQFYENVTPPIGRIGITQFEHSNKEKKLYFQQVPRANAHRDAIFNQAGVPVVFRVQEILRGALNGLYSVSIPQEPLHGPYFSGLIRSMGSADLHFDYAPYDAPSWMIGEIEKQLAWNIYIAFPPIGGECIVYNRPWEPSRFEKFLSESNTGSYGFKQGAIQGAESIAIKPDAGDLVFFNSRNFHKVLPSTEGERISISSFVGTLDKGDTKELVLWS